jgi:nickel-dependent lactate racemase
MIEQLRYGLNSTIEYEPSKSAAVVRWDGPRDEALGDVRSATAAALAQPLGFPPLGRAIVPGDKVVLALEAAVPCAAEIVAATIDALIGGGIAVSDITILRAACADGDTAASDPRAGLGEHHREAVELATHQGATREELSYLTADEHDQPIYLNRRIVDADVVVPIGCLRADALTGYGGVHALLYPTFADQAAQQRCRLHRASKAGRNGSQRNRAASVRGERKRPPHVAITQREADHVAWLLGVLFTIQVIPSASGGVLHVLAGQTDQVLERGSELTKRTWSFEVPKRAKLVVAAVDGGAQEQTWDNVGRALAAAERIVADDGIIAVCTELQSAPGPALRAVGGIDDPELFRRKLREQQSEDLAVAQQWASARSHARIYLLSGLREEQVERLGAAYVAEPKEVSRLIARMDSCAVLGCAQNVLPTAAERA